MSQAAVERRRQALRRIAGFSLGVLSLVGIQYGMSQIGSFSMRLLAGGAGYALTSAVAYRAASGGRYAYGIGAAVGAGFYGWQASRRVDAFLAGPGPGALSSVASSNTGSMQQMDRWIRTWRFW